MVGPASRAGPEPPPTPHDPPRPLPPGVPDMTAPRTFTTATLGCKVNQYETQYVKELLESAGWVEAEAGRRAELCVVNTCTVTHEGDAKGRQTVRRLHQAHPEATLMVMGCYASRDRAAVAALPGVRHVVADKERLGEELRPYGVLGPPARLSPFYRPRPAPG